MNLKTIPICCGFLAILSLSSCHSTEFKNEIPPKPIYQFEQNASDNFVAVQNLKNYDWSYYDGCNYTIIFDENDNSCSIQISDIQFDQNQRTTLTFLNLPQTSFKDPNVKGTSYVGSFATNSEASMSTYYISDLSIECLLDQDRTFGYTEKNGEQIPAPVGVQPFISFTINNSYKIRIIQKKNYFYGLTSSVCSGGEFDPFHTQSSKYLLNLNPTMKTARLTIENAQFVNGMPKGITMDFSGIDFTITDTGILLASASLIPTANNRPFQMYEVTDLQGIVSYATKLALSFHCPHVPIPMDSDDTYSFSVTVDAPYSLTSR